jgi:2-(1,2-epoxy-1,2-dihydrophenyl)acetyl-CoA isomerase
MKKTAEGALAQGVGAKSSDSTDTLAIRIAGGVASVSLNRPDRGNAITSAMARDLSVLAARLCEDESVRAIVLTASGSNFTVGGDIEQFSTTRVADRPAMFRKMIDDYHLALERLSGLDAPIVAAVRGAAAGGGLGLLYVADVVVAAENAVFTVGYGGLGLTVDGGNSWFLPRLIGLRRAQEMFLLNRRLSAGEALQCGLVTKVVPEGDLDAEARRIGEKLANGPTRAFGGMRRLLRRSYESSLRDQLAAEQESIIEISKTHDVSEGIDAFAAHRKPSFEGW